MPKDYNALFVADPIGFMNKYSVVAADHVGNLGTNEVTLNRDNVIDTPNFYVYRQMGWFQRTAYLDFTKVRHVSGAGIPQRTGQIEVSGSYVRDDAKVKSYFLPWDNNAIISLEIPRRSLAQYFFTAAISGCSIFIKGTPDNPTIYHAGGNTGRRDPREGASFWREMMQTYGPTSGPMDGEVNKTQYVTDKLDKMQGTENSRRFKKWLEKQTSDDYLIEDVAPTGCVMGINNGGQWEFYLQENASITYSRFTKEKQGLLGIKKKVKLTGTTNVVMRPMQVTRFYPHGVGHIRVTPALSRVLKD